MKCCACDKLLSDFETTRKIVREEGKVEYPDMCNTCFKESGIWSMLPVIERTDLVHDIIMDTEEDFE